MSDKTIICQKCNEAEVIWMHTPRGKAVLVDAASAQAGETQYDKARHSCHWETCKNKPEGAGNPQFSGPAFCKDCGEEVVWMLTKRGKKVPVNVNTYHDELIYNDWVNKCHWETCVAKNEQGPPAGEGVTFDESEIPF